MKEVIFRGVGTALVTPLHKGEIDYEALERLIERQIEAGVDAIIIGGTTGEAATLTDVERYSLFREAKRIINSRVKLVLGTGTNDTRASVRHTKEAEKVGCDGLLVVTPYYNKGTEEGLYNHFRKIASSTSLPIMLYNVPSRTGVNLGINLLFKLKEIENVVAIKEASDSTDRLVELASLIPDIALYSGNDSQIYPCLSLGGMGVVSVVSNLCPRQTVKLCKEFFAGNIRESLKIQHGMLPIIKSLFLETNPAPIKYALMKMGLCEGEMRLPMWLPSTVTRKKIDKILQGIREF